MIKVGVIVPTRGDRPQLLQNLIRMINYQLFQPTLVYVVDESPKGSECDITYRYRTGYDWFRGMGMDVLAMMEDDDWYSPGYLAEMVSNWLRAGRPELFGTNYTLYYNLKLSAAYRMRHTKRSAAMSTFIKPDMEFGWCPDKEAYTDVHLWMHSKHKTGNRLNGKLFSPETHICLGIKGYGAKVTGGSSHTTDLHRYKRNGSFQDHDLSFLRQTVDQDSFKLYSLFMSHNAVSV